MDKNEMLAEFAEVVRKMRAFEQMTGTAKQMDAAIGNASYTAYMFIYRHHAEIEAMEKESQESHDLIEKVSDILTRTANAMKGKPAPLHSHSWHDLPEVAEAMARDAARLMFVFEADGFVHVERDRYDYATDCCEENGRDAPTPEDELNGVRRLIDAAMHNNASDPHE